MSTDFFDGLLSEILGARNLDREQLLRAILDGAIRLTGADRGFIMLYSPERRLTVELALDRSGEPVPPGAFDFSQTITRRVLETRELLHIPRIAPDSHRDEYLQAVELGKRTWEALPPGLQQSFLQNPRHQELKHDIAVLKNRMLGRSEHVD